MSERFDPPTESPTVTVVAAKWILCHRCGAVEVLVTLDYSGTMLCTECLIELVRLGHR